MDQQNGSSQPLLPPNFTSAAFSSQFPGINNVTSGTAISSSPLLMSLQQLSGAAGIAAAAAGILPPAQLGGQFAGISWSPAQQAASWIDQANKMAAILPMYNALQTAAGSVSESSTTYNSAPFPTPTCMNFSTTGMANIPLKNDGESAPMVSPSFGLKSRTTQWKDTQWRAGSSVTSPHSGQSCSHSASTSSHPPSNETATMAESPLNVVSCSVPNQTAQFNGSPARTIGSQSNQSFIPAESTQTHVIEEGDLSGLELHDFGDFLGRRNREEGRHNPGPPINYNQSASHVSNVSHSSPMFMTNEQDRKSYAHQFHVDELANADKELDRLVSLVASQNAEFQLASESNTNTFSQDPLNVFKTEQDQPLFDDKPISQALNAVQFTPPDSPTNDPTTSGEAFGLTQEINRPSLAAISNTPPLATQIFKTPLEKCSTPSPSHLTQSKSSTPRSMDSPRSSASSATLPLVFIPKASPSSSPEKTLQRRGLFAQPSNKLARVPIYKQRESTTFSIISSPSKSTFLHQPAKKEEKKDDAYSFTDDEFGDLAKLGDSSSPFKSSGNLKIRKPSSQAQSVYMPPNIDAEANPSDILKHVVPKKRHSVASALEQAESHSTEPSTSKHINVPNVATSADMSSEIHNLNSQSGSRKLVEMIRKIRHNRMSFLKSEVMEGNDCIKPEIAEEARQRKKKKHKKHKKEKRNLELESWDDLTPLSEEGSKDSAHMKRRRLQQENAEEKENDKDNETTDNDSMLHYENSLISTRLNCFARADLSSLCKGTFLVAKDDVFKPDCSLWKIDNQNLLQKYLPLQGTNAIVHYKNSSTYAGWCDQMADEYLLINVKHLKHSRAESIVEPLIPVQDLFPAINTQLSGQSIIAGDDDRKREKNSVFTDDIKFGKESLRSHLTTFAKAMLNETICPNFLQSIKATNDWNYLCALNEIEQLNIKAIDFIKKRHKWCSKFEEDLQKYPNIAISSHDVFMEECQGCAETETTNTVHLFNVECVTAESPSVLDKGISAIQEATEFLVCSTCAIAAKHYHTLKHMKSNVLRQCEDHLESVYEEEENIAAESIVQQCLNDRSWLQNLFNEYLDLWKKSEEHT
ncbi:proline-rich protein 12 [Ditylenchus destructor]|nr:proline-rich protein 12 [Ditylenchus destructor]